MKINQDHKKELEKINQKHKEEGAKLEKSISKLKMQVDANANINNSVMAIGLVIMACRDKVMTIPEETRRWKKDTLNKEFIHRELDSITAKQFGLHYKQLKKLGDATCKDKPPFSKEEFMEMVYFILPEMKHISSPNSSMNRI